MLPSTGLVRALAPLHRRLVLCSRRNLNLSGARLSMSTAADRYPGRKIYFRDPNLWYVDFNADQQGRGTIVSIQHPKPRYTFNVARTWLRNACSCETCVDPSSGQKRFSVLDIPQELSVSNMIRSEDGSLQVTWESDFFTLGTHVSTYPQSTINEIMSTLKKAKSTNTIIWDKTMLNELEPFFNYEKFMTDKKVFSLAMSVYRSHGIFILQGVPSSEEIVEKIGTKIGVIQNTFYGMTWDVKAKPNAENVAYTSSYLGLHQDLLYEYQVPRVQILHCMKNTCEGGESLFSDGTRAVVYIRSQFPELARALEKRRIRYSYNKGGHHYNTAREVLSPRITYPFWSPPFEDPVQLTPVGDQLRVDYQIWLEAARKLRDLIEDEKCVYEFKMNEGDCVVFNNNRLLHGRRQFDPSSGERWLRGTYVEGCSVTSTLENMEETLQSAEKIPTMPKQMQAMMKRHQETAS